MGIAEIIKNLGVRSNVLLRVLDASTQRVISEVQGHNSATHTMLIGAAHYLKGDGVLNQGYEMLSQYIPRYISLGTMGLINQNEDENGLPAGIGVTGDPDEDEEQRFTDYINQVPGFGADGYDAKSNNNRAYFGLGPKYSDEAIKCELISDSFPRSQITYRMVLPESQSELPETIDIVYSAFISTGALAQFRGDRDYIFITETGLWSSPVYDIDTQTGLPSGAGLVAGYRITPANDDEYDMASPENRQKLKESILRVGKNQIVQIIWKIQIGIGGAFAYDSTTYRRLMEIIENGSTGDRCVFGTNNAILIHDFSAYQIGAVSSSNTITSDSITSLQGLATWLSTNACPDYFDEVTYSNSTIDCRKDGRSAMAMNGSLINIYKAQGVYQSTGDALYTFAPYSNNPSKAIKGVGGILIALNGYASGGYGGCAEFIITKDNLGNTTIIAVVCGHNAFSSGTRGTMLRGADDRNLITASWGDNQIIDMVTSFAAMSQSVTELVPFAKCPGADNLVTNYTPYAFYIPSGSLYSYGTEYNKPLAEFTLNGISYYTNGYWAVRKEL